MAELVILVGLPGAGKTSFHRDRFTGTHVHVSKDLLRNRRDKQTHQLALTGYGQPQDRQMAAEAGFDAHMVKPIAPPDLSRLLASLSR